MGIRPRLYAARVCAGTTREAPPRPLSRLCGESQPLCPACWSCTGHSGETSPTQQKSHGAFMLHGFDWFGDLWGGDAGGCGQLLLSLPGLGRTPAPPTFPGCAENPGPYPPASHAGVFQRNLPRPTKKPWGFMLHGFDWFGDLLGGDAGGCGQLLLSLPGLGRAPTPLPCRVVRRMPACATPAGHARGIPLKLPPPNKKAMGLYAPWL